MEKMDQSDNYDQRILKLEDDELELKANTATYVELLALYLYKNEIDYAKFLLQRVPASLKTESKELERLQILFKSLQQNNMSEFFRSIKYNWSENIKEIMDALLVKTKVEFFELISYAYTSILEAQLLQMTQMSREELQKTCQELGWSSEEDNNGQIFILPKQTDNPTQTCGSSKEQLLKLTEFVSFLEN